MQLVNPASALQTVTRSNQTEPEPSKARPSASMLDQFWRRMLAMFGNTWASQYGEKPDGITSDTWAGVLSGVTGPQIAAGLHACAAEGREFPPNAPRFRAMCLGIPSFARVRLEITQSGMERSPFTRSVWTFVDGHDYRHASAKDADRILQAAYDAAHDLAMRGEPLPKPAAAKLEHEAPPPVVLPDTKEARIEHMRALLGDDFNPAAAQAADEAVPA